MSQAVAEKPSSAVAEHNLAAALGDAGRWHEALQHIRTAQAKGGNAPETALVLARALVETGELEGAERAYTKALALRPSYHDAHVELSQLIWMKTGDSQQALRSLDAALAAHPEDNRLQLAKIKVLENTGQEAIALALALDLCAAQPDDLAFATAAAQLALGGGDADLGLRLARRAFAVAPHSPVAATTYATNCLALGLADEALSAIESVRASEPTNQFAIALQATAWRLLGDPRYRALFDYERFVKSYRLAAPSGWPSLEAYLTDLSAGARRQTCAPRAPLQSIDQARNSSHEHSRCVQPRPPGSSGGAAGADTSVLG
ncbi:MAG: tetratricopeptide repeat protein [Hyphomonadaceae bacterium]